MPSNIKPVSEEVQAEVLTQWAALQGCAYTSKPRAAIGGDFKAGPKPKVERRSGTVDRIRALHAVGISKAELLGEFKFSRADVAEALRYRQGR